MVHPPHVEQTIPFSAYDAMWYMDPTDNGYYRMLIHRGQDPLACSVKGAKTSANLNRFDELIEGVLYEAVSPEEIDGNQEQPPELCGPTSSITTRMARSDLPPQDGTQACKAWM
jgi:hypothetical protein